ncbi:MAG: caspase domain-containing protein [Paracoccaceae bacterium]
MITVLLLMAAQVAIAADRVALVIGNAAYQAIPALDNPGNDARLIAERLRALEFDVTLELDLPYRGMRLAIREFGEVLDRAGSDAIAVIYYAGHAVQLSGANYLLPVDARINDASDISVDGLHLDTLLHQIDHAAPAASIVILDACRDNPFGSRVTLSPGLAQTGAPRDTLLAYSTAPGQVALDGAGANSPYTAALADALVQPGVTIEAMFKSVRRAVLAETGGMQTPWESSSLTRTVAFGPQTPSDAQPAAGSLAANWDVLGWTDMTGPQRAAWAALGWSAASWAGEIDPPASDDESWDNLTDQQRIAAMALGYSEDNW